jgi:hypothetical protein
MACQGEPTREEAMSAAQPSESTPPEPVVDPAPTPLRRPSVLESVLDNLSVWTVIAAAISFLYIVWATIDVLNVYTGDLPSFGP